MFFDVPWISLGEKQLIFKCGRQRTTEMPEWMFMKKLGSLQSRTDEILLLCVSPKSNCPRKMAQNSRLWCRRELWIKTFQSRFCCPRIQHDTLPHRPVSNKVARPPVLTKHLLEPRSTFYVRLFHITSSNKTSFQLTPISHRIVGVNNKCSKDNWLVTLNISFCVKWNNMEWACFRACFPGTSRLAPAYANAHEWMFMLAHRNPMGNLQILQVQVKNGTKFPSLVPTGALN